MSLSVSRGIIADASKDLKRSWRRARELWDDEPAHRFERVYLDPLAPKIRSAVEAMDKLAAITARAERACADEGDA